MMRIMLDFVLNENFNPIKVKYEVRLKGRCISHRLTFDDFLIGIACLGLHDRKRLYLKLNELLYENSDNWQRENLYQSNIKYIT